MCHQANEDRAWQCRRCGYEFGQPIDQVIDLLRGQLRTNRILFASFAALEVALVGGYIWLHLLLPPILPATAFVVGMVLTVRAAFRIRLTRESLRALSAQQAALPKATLVSDD